MSGGHLTTSEEAVEPELVEPGAGPRAGGTPSDGGAGLLTRLKLLAAAGLGLLAAVLFFVGALLTSTVIGAILGVPLMLAGAVLFYLLFKLLTFGSKSSFIIRRF